MTTLHRPAVVTSAKRAACSGQMGKRCTCGLWHTPGGATVSQGIQTAQFDMPIQYVGPEPSILASKEFWALGASILSVCAAIGVYMANHYGWFR